MPQVIEWADYPGKEQDIVWKYPNENISWGSALIVHEYEFAAFFRDGKMYDVFTAGRHLLSTQNLPLLTRVFKVAYGQTPFKATIFFTSTKEFTGFFGGRSQTRELFPLLFNGQYWFKIKDPVLFVNEVVGGNLRYTTPEVIDFLRGFINQSTTTELSKYDLGPVFSLGLDSTASRTKVMIDGKFARFGVEVFDLKFNAIDTVDEYRNLAVMVRQGVPASEVLKYWTVRESAKELGKSPGAAIGAGLILPQMLGQTPGVKFSAATEEIDPVKILKQRLAKGEITKQEYAKLKKALED
jgi:membrane protease subunit (stomatin/prohibitin family)